jgi:hypothetical protein
MVGREDIGRVNDCGIVRPGHIRRNSATQVAGEKLVFTSRYVNRFTQAWQKRLTIRNQTRKSQNLIDADSELNHVSESSSPVTSFASA